MIPVPTGARVFIATGLTDMRKGFDSLALAVQERLKMDPHAGQVFIFRGRRGDLIKTSGMTARGCVFFQSDWSAGVSSGRRRPPAPARTSFD